MHSLKMFYKQCDFQKNGHELFGCKEFSETATTSCNFESILSLQLVLSSPSPVKYHLYFHQCVALQIKSVFWFIKISSGKRKK